MTAQCTSISRTRKRTPILFLIIANIILDTDDIPHLPDYPKTSSAEFSYVDDSATVVISTNYKSPADLLAKIIHQQKIQRAEIELPFSSSKAELIKFSRNRTTKRPEGDYPTLNTITPIQPSTNIRYLGVILDKRLNFNYHGREITFQGAQSVATLYSIGNKSSGLVLDTRMRLVNNLFLPKISRAFSAWCYHQPSITN
jgi:hypothetical protein